MTNINKTPEEKLRTRLFDELESADVESPAFKAAFESLLKLEKDPVDSELAELEKEHVRVKIEKDRLDIERARLEPLPVQKRWYQPNPDVVVQAAAGLAGILTIVAAEQFGSMILNSKAFNRLPRP